MLFWYIIEIIQLQYMYKCNRIFFTLQYCNTEIIIAIQHMCN